MWLTLHGHGQAMPEQNATPPAPAARVMDESGFFKGKPKALSNISASLQKLEQEHGYSIFLMVEPVLIGPTPQEMAASLRQAWLPGGNGESDSGNIGVGRDLERDVSEQPSLIPSFETAAMINRAVAAVDGELKGAAFLERLMSEFTRELNRYFQRIGAPAPVERSLRFGILAVGTLSLLGLVAIGVGAFIRHSSMAAVERFRFPEVDTRERLGASCGSSVTVRRFVPQAEPPP